MRRYRMDLSVLGRFVVVLAVISVFAGMLSCFDDDPAKPSDDDEDPVNPYSGTFALTSVLVSNTCAVPVPPGSMINITVEGDSMWFGTFPGEWDSLSTSGGGTSPEVTVPVIIPTCYSYYTITYEIEFTDEDNFTGTYRSDFRKDATCPNPAPCSFTYSMTGTRD